MSTTGTDSLRPPCWPAGQPCPNACAGDHYRRVVDNHSALYGPWSGWRMAGRDLIGPEGIRLSERRLRGLLWREASEQRIAQARIKRAAYEGRQYQVTVIRLPLADWHRETFGTSVA